MTPAHPPVLVDTPVARRVPHRALPLHTFVSGLTARPDDAWMQTIPEEEWFAFACDLFDAGYGFEAHELWERVWHAARARHDDDVAMLCKGLIKLAAALVKLRAGHPIAAASHVDGACTALAHVGAQHACGLSVVRVREIASAARARLPSTIPPPGAPVFERLP